MAEKMLHAYEESLERAKNIRLLSEARKEIIRMQFEHCLSRMSETNLWSC